MYDTEYCQIIAVNKVHRQCVCVLCKNLFLIYYYSLQKDNLYIWIWHNSMCTHIWANWCIIFTHPFVYLVNDFYFLGQNSSYYIYAYVYNMCVCACVYYVYVFMYTYDVCKGERTKMMFLQALTKVRYLIVLAVAIADWYFHWAHSMGFRRCFFNDHPVVHPWACSAAYTYCLMEIQMDRHR